VANCPAGKRATGGGVGSAVEGEDSDRVVQSGPVDETGTFNATQTGDVPVGWFGKYANGPRAKFVYTWAICG
jgi:hypothetical protein